MTNKTKKQMNKAQMNKAKGGIWVDDTGAGVADRLGRVSWSDGGTTGNTSDDDYSMNPKDVIIKNIHLR